MKKPTTGRHAGAGFSRNDLVTSSRRFIADLPPDNQVAVPPNFDPKLNPILAHHWFGVHPQGVSALWWRLAGLGQRLPAEKGVIVVQGGRHG